MQVSDSIRFDDLLRVARHRFAREGHTHVLKLLWLNDEVCTPTPLHSALHSAS